MLAQRVRGLLGLPVQLQAFGIAAADRARSRYSFDRIAQETTAAYEHCRCARTAALTATVDEELADVAEEVRGVAAFA